MPTKPKGKIDLAFAIGLPPEKAITYLKNKGYAISGDWWEVWQEAHGKGFTVAKAMQADILEDIRVMVQKGLDKGITLHQFQKELTPKLVSKGWWGKKEVDGREVQLGSPGRLTTIYRTNMQTAFNAGRYKDQVENIEGRPYWMYVAVMDSLTRPSHGAMNGAVFKATDPFWNTHYPSNGFNCRCRVRALTEDQVKAKGLEVLDSTGKLSEKMVEVSKGVEKSVTTFKGYGRTMTPDAGWSYNPGKVDFKPNFPKYKPPVKKKLKTALASDGYAKRVPVNDYPDIEKMMVLFHDENPDMFVRGKPKIEIDTLKPNSKGGITAMWARPDGTIGLNDYYLSHRSWNPAADLKSALIKIRKDEALSLAEEYSIEALWHEVLHQRAKGRVQLPAQSHKRVMMETMNQFVARHTYPSFLRSLGGYESHGAEILNNGFGYATYINNFRAILKSAGIDEMKAVEKLSALNIVAKWDKMPNEIAKALAELYGDSKTWTKFNRLFAYIYESDKNSSEIISNHFKNIFNGTP